MPRLISFSKTLEQVRSKQKTVTRRTGWAWLEEGTLLKPVEKAMGLKKGESVTPIFDDGTLIRVVSVRRELLVAVLEYDHLDVGACLDLEVCREGFPEMTGSDFVEFFCDEMGCDPDTEVTRIEFEYVEAKAVP